jgi:hypothetical protein
MQRIKDLGGGGGGGGGFVKIKDFGGGSLIKPYLTIVALSVFRAMVIMSKNIPDNWQGFSVENIPTQLWKSQE